MGVSFFIKQSWVQSETQILLGESTENFTEACACTILFWYPFISFVHLLSITFFILVDIFIFYSNSVLFQKVPRILKKTKSGFHNTAFPKDIEIALLPAFFFYFLKCTLYLELLIATEWQRIVVTQFTTWNFLFLLEYFTFCTLDTLMFCVQWIDVHDIIMATLPNGTTYVCPSTVELTTVSSII